MKTVKKFNKPGAYEILIPFSKKGMEREWMGILRATPQAAHAGGQAIYELNVKAVHTAPNTRGRVVVRAVASHGAQIKLSGIIKISKNAQGTDNFLELRVLLLDQQSMATVDPQLEIEANEVKAGHAASVGQIDNEQILYLQSRGLKEEEAKREIVEGWLGV